MQEQLIAQGLDLMLFGMGSVFVFLAVLVVATMLMSKLIVKYCPVEATPVLANTDGKPVVVTDKKLLAIVQAAIEQHRKR